ncbi:MAG: hypothetical protein RLO03_13805 [Balneola sp.]
MQIPKKLQNINYLVAVPLIVMSYHIFNFYETEPTLVRISLALSFDLMVVVCFYLLKDPMIAKLKHAKKATWIALLVLISFQLYVNVWAYWELHWFRAVLSGSILPVSVAFITYISMLREQQAEIKEAKDEKRQQAQEKIQEIFETEAGLKEIAGEYPFEDVKVEKPEVIKAFNKDPETASDLFLRCDNRRSVLRWLKKLEKGETP